MIQSSRSIIFQWMAHILHILIFSIPGQNIYFCMVYTRDTDSIYTIILLLANGRSQFLLDRLGRCLKLFVSTESTSCHEFASQFGLEFFYKRKTLKTSGKPGHQCQCLCQWPATSYSRQRSGPSRLGGPHTHRIAIL